MKKVMIILVLATMVFTACVQQNPFPQDGSWYCEKLKMNISFDPNEPWVVNFNGEMKFCGGTFDEETGYIRIYVMEEKPEKIFYCLPKEQQAYMSAEENNSGWNEEIMIFYGYCRSWNADEMILVVPWSENMSENKGRIEGYQFTFNKIGDSETGDGLREPF